MGVGNGGVFYGGLGIPGTTNSFLSTLSLPESPQPPDELEHSSAVAAHNRQRIDGGPQPNGAWQPPRATS